jgi:uncharacterized membrane protein YczE
VLPFPSRAELRRRWPRLTLGLVGYGVGIAFMVEAGLGLGPWDVLHQGINHHTGIPLGTVGILVGIALLVLWIPLKERVGIGTIGNTIVIGLVLDATVWAMPDVESLLLRWALLLGGILGIALGSGASTGAGLGPGPRDGLMTGLARKGVGSVRVVRTGIELTVLALGWLLGGTVGIGTVLLAVTIGPLVQVFLGWLSLPPLDGALEDPALLEPPAEPAR